MRAKNSSAKRGYVPKRTLMLYLVKNLTKRVLKVLGVKFLPLARIRALIRRARFKFTRRTRFKFYRRTIRTLKFRLAALRRVRFKLRLSARFKFRRFVICLFKFRLTLLR